MNDEQSKGASPGISLTELLKRKRAEARAGAAERAARSQPVLLSRPPPPSDATTKLLPVRNSFGSLSQNVMVDPKPSSHNALQSSSIVVVRPPNLSSTEHIVLLPIASMVRQVYEATVKNSRHEIRNFLNDDQTELAVLKQLDAMVDQLKLLTDHQDLIMDASATQETSDDLQSKWTETCSSKCLFLRELLDAMRPQEKHIAIFARSGRMLDILEVLLKVNKFAYRRMDRFRNVASNAIGALRVTLIPTNPENGKYVVNPADAVIAFDNTFRPAELGMIRNQLSDSGRLSPLIYLIITNSVEGIELCSSKALSPTERRRFLIQYIIQTVSTIGILDLELPEPEQAAAAVAGYLSNDLEENPSWPLPENHVFLGAEEESEKLIFQSPRPATQTHIEGIRPQGAIKRSFGIEATGSEETDSTKRMRMTPAPVEQSSDKETTHIGDSVDFSNETDLASLDNALREKIIDLESRLQLKEGVEAELRRLIANLEADLEGQKKTIRKIEPKFRRAINDRGKAQSEGDAAKSQVPVLTDRLEVSNAEVSRLKEVVEALTIELTTARTALTSSTVPETAELAKAQADVTSLRADKGRLEKRISMMEQDFEFTRDSYQKASSAAAELGNEVLALKNEMENLQRKASENIIRVAEIQRSNESEEREARIDELHALLSERERELWKTREELRVKSNGRRETRGTSLPQSPRGVSGALSPRLQYGRGASVSRQNSPAAGEAMRESHKDPILFLQSGPRSARWDHLV